MNMPFKCYLPQDMNKCFIESLAMQYRIAQLWGGGKYWRKVYLERVVGNILANLYLNKTICAYIIVPKHLKFST